MKIRRLQITMEPHPLGSHYIIIEVNTNCGNTFSSMHYLEDTHFQDVFGCLMKDAEHRIRQLVKEKTEPADIKI